MTADETPQEHVRNAMHLLLNRGRFGRKDGNTMIRSDDLRAALDRLRRAVEILERKASNG